MAITSLMLVGIPRTGQETIDDKAEAEVVTSAERFDRRRRYIGAAGVILFLLLA